MSRAGGQGPGPPCPFERRTHVDMAQGRYSVGSEIHS